MPGKPQFSDLLTVEFFQKHFMEERMSFPQIAEMLCKMGTPMDQSTLNRYATRLGIKRSFSESRRNREIIQVDYKASHSSEKAVEWLDGFLLGDGCLSLDETGKTARACCGLEHEEFALYMMSGFDPYITRCHDTKEDSMRSGIKRCGYTRYHPDLGKEYHRWYKQVDGKYFKTVPKDVRITPTSVMLWYLGDGSIVDVGRNCVALRLSTDGFSEADVESLAAALRTKGIACHRNGDNRIWIDAKGIPAFFFFIGRKSPVSCYDYKFDLPAWRFEAKRMREVADELGIDYQRLAHLVKIGTIPCYRASAKGKPRFLAEHIGKVKEVFTAEGRL